jgi:nucleoside-diphosphate-sugar epimerase
VGKILVTGGAGYVGCVLVPRLLAAGHAVVVFDIMYYGAEGLPSHPELEVVQGDLRDSLALDQAASGCDAAIHLACISSDPSFEVEPALSRSINYDCFEAVVAVTRRAGVRRFIYASTSSVYGHSDAPEITEDHPLAPITDYDRYKCLCERIVLRHQAPDFTTTIIRPASVCGYSPRMRFDLTVNILTNHAVNRGAITVFGGAQKRPTIHVEDLAELYARLLEYPAPLVAGEIFNVGHQNYTLAQLAEIVRKVVDGEMPEKAPIRIETTATTDPRSYHVSSRKIAHKLQWTPHKMVENAIRDLCQAFREGKLPDSMTDDRYSNVRTLKQSVMV